MASSVDLPAPFGPTSATDLARLHVEIRRLECDLRAEAPRDAAGGEKRRLRQRVGTAGGFGTASGASGRGAGSTPTSTGTETVPPTVQGSSAIRSEKNSQIARGGEQRQRDEDSGQAVDLATGEQPEDHEQRVQPERAAHHVGNDDVPLELVDGQEEECDPEHGDRVDDRRVQQRRHRAEPGPDVRDQLGDGDPGAEEDRVAVAARQPPEDAQDPQPDTGAHTDDQRDQELPLDVAGDRALDAPQ